MEKTYEKTGNEVKIMSFSELVSELHMNDRIFAVTRVRSEVYSRCEGDCVMRSIPALLRGEEKIFAPETNGCRGYKSNSGFSADPPAIPGGAEYFLSYGRGEGFPEGERLKKTPEIAKEYFDSYPRQTVLPGNAYRVTPYTEGCEAEVVWMFATPDQLSALIMLYTFRTSDSSEEFLLSFASGCGSLFAQPFSQLTAAHPRAVLGCTDLASRPYFDKNLLSLSVTHGRFLEMLEDTPECFFHGAFWKKLRGRL